MMFNINDCVKVKLTDFGRKVHREEFDNLMQRLPPHASLQYRAPREDADGWSEWQLWILMETFGRYCTLGGPEPFETTIIIPDKPDQPITIANALATG